MAASSATTTTEAGSIDDRWAGLREMTLATPLLTTKLYIPPPHPNLVQRSHLIERLGAGLRRGCKLTLVSAPAGFGKTTLVTEWVVGDAREVAWISLDEGDNDPVQFFAYLIAALQQVDGSIGRMIQQLLQSPQLPPLRSLVTPLINDVVAVGTPITLVLDDYHFISSPAIHEAVGFLLAHQPPTMHLVISTREDVPESLPLPRLRVRGQVTEVRKRDLCFSAGEIAAFFNRTLNLDLSVEAARALESRTEGWVVGLQLAALALQEDQQDAETFIAAFTGDERCVIDYLVAEVLQRQPEAVRDFLRQTAVLDRMTISLCNAVTGKENGRAMLDRLEGANLLISLDNEREWYRYHRLFAEALRATLAPEEEWALHRRAMGWHEAHGLVNRAIEHALAAHAVDEAERLICLVAEETMQAGHILTLQRWLAALPDARVRAEGYLSLYRAWTLALMGELVQAEGYIDAAEAHFRRTDAPDEAIGKLLIFRSFVAVLVEREYEKGMEMATEALRLLGDSQPQWHIIALWAMAESLERTQNIARAIETFCQAQQAGLTLGEHVFAIVIEGALTKALNDHGERRRALAICQEAIDRHTDGGKRPSLLTGHLFTWMGVVAYEANQLEQARAYHDRAIVLSEQLGLEHDLTFSYGLAALTLYALGEADAALAALQETYQNALQIGYADPGWFLAQEAHIRLREGDLPAALRWAQEVGLSLDDELEALDITAYLMYGRLLLAQGRLADARRWLERLARFLEENGLYRWLMSVRIQQALVAERSGQRVAARDYLTQAVKAAAPEDYLRAFLDEDAQVLTLLRDVRDAAPAFVDRILNYARDTELEQEAAPQTLTEPLSEREVEVLGLIAAGLANREIAERLFIAVGTVKRHANNIYGKLDVHSRTQAVAQAQELGLI
jgi:LuxR family maltose regulon positive regulatory protein